MRRAPPAGIGEMHVFESDGRLGAAAPPASRCGPRSSASAAPAGPAARRRRARGCRRRPTARPGPGAAPAQVAQRAEHLGPGHQHDQQRLDRHQPVGDPPYPERQRRGGADRDPGIGDAAGHHARREDAHRRVRQLVRALGEPPAIGCALAERLQGRQALHRVEELRAEALHRLLARRAGPALDRGTPPARPGSPAPRPASPWRPARPTTR